VSRWPRDVGRLFRCGIVRAANLRAVDVWTVIDPAWLSIAPSGDQVVFDAKCRYEQVMMFVVVVESAEYLKVVALRFRPLVRLYLVQKLPHIGGDAGPDVGKCWAAAAADIRSLANREVRVSAGRLTASGYHKLPGEIIKRHWQVVNGVANDRAQDWRDRKHVAYAEDVLRASFIALSPHGYNKNVAIILTMGTGGGNFCGTNDLPPKAKWVVMDQTPFGNPGPVVGRSHVKGQRASK